MLVSGGLVVLMPWYSWGISCRAFGMTVFVNSVDALVGWVFCGMAVHPSAGEVCCRLCGEGTELLPLDDFFEVSTWGLGQHICMR